MPVSVDDGLHLNSDRGILVGIEANGRAALLNQHFGVWIPLGLETLSQVFAGGFVVVLWPGAGI